MLTELQKSKIRRHLQYPVAGLLRTSPAGGTLAQGSVGYRFLQAYGFLEYRMNNLSPVEEAQLTGLAYGAAALVGPQPNTGDSVTLTITPTGQAAQTLVAVAPAQSPPGATDARLTLCNALASASALNPILQAAGIIALTPYGTGAFSQNAVAVPEVSFSAPAAFTITGSSSGTSGLTPQITAPGSFIDPSTSLDGVTTIFGFIPILDGLLNAYATASQNLDTRKADVWEGRINEAGARRSLYENWKQLMADFLGTPLFKQARQAPQRTGAIRYA
jgi:hypothetical protein